MIRLFGCLTLVLALHGQPMASQNWDFSQFSPRLLTHSDERWIQSQVSETALVSLNVFEVGYEPWLGIDAVKAFEAYQPDFKGREGTRFVAPKKSTSFPELARGIRVEQSGQSMTLPDINLPELSGFSIERQLQYWLSQDLTPLQFLIQSAQQEIGWSDFEVALLLRRYAATLLPVRTQTLFLAAYWHQAGYQVQISLDQGQPSLFYRIDTTAVAWPMVRYQSRQWITLDREFSGEVRLPQALELRGQSLRLNSMNDRSSSTQFSAVTYRFNTGNQNEDAQFELPSYWVSINRSLLPHAMLYSLNVPSYLLSQISSMVQSDSEVETLRALAQWLQQDFENTNEAISVQQALMLKKQNNETRVILLAAWWAFLTSQSAAIVVENGQYYLALKLVDSQLTENVILNRGHRWWLWRPDLTTSPSLSDVSPSKWIFIP
jgi:hypothetical protein